MSDNNDGARIFLGKGEAPEHLALRYANRHGLIAGATGTGKTVSLQIIAEGLCAAGVPVFLADVKGDLAGLSQPVEMKSFLEERAAAVGLKAYAPRAFPVRFWDLLGAHGHPVRTTITEMGPVLLSRLLGLNDTQSGVMTLAFRLADDEGLLLLDLKDLRALLVEIAARRKELSAEYGHIATSSVGAIQRRVLALEEEGADQFFGEPALDIHDLIDTQGGEGVINILDARALMKTPKLYATFLLWMLSELFEVLPEIGDQEKPKLVFFFDEAHLLFDDAPKALLEKIEQVVRLIRSKGVGVFFSSQNPLDIPDSVSSQLGARIQHALRAYTPKERRVLRAAAQSFRDNPAFKAEEVIAELGIGEALVSTLEAKGAPGVVQRTLIRPPQSRMGPVSSSERAQAIAASPLGRRYGEAFDRRSAYEILKERAERAAKSVDRPERAPAKKRARRSSGRQSIGEAAMKSAARTLANALVRGLLGSLKKKR